LEDKGISPLWSERGTASFPEVTSVLPMWGWSPWTRLESDKIVLDL